MSELVRRLVWRGKENAEDLLAHEWMVTSGLGGYASSTLGGIATRRFHGLLINQRNLRRRGALHDPR
jgi:hypothetical protein